MTENQNTQVQESRKPHVFKTDAHSLLKRIEKLMSFATTVDQDRILAWLQSSVAAAHASKVA